MMFCVKTMSAQFPRSVSVVAVCFDQRDAEDEVIHVATLKALFSKFHLEWCWDGRCGDARRGIMCLE